MARYSTKFAGLAILSAVAFSLLYETGSRTTIHPIEVYVIDGDTIAVGDIRYRLTGYDTPETYRAECEAERAHGLRAKARLAQLIKNNSDLTLDVEARPDKYGRLLARAKIGNHEVANLLIREGLARPYGGGKRGKWCNEAGGFSL